MSAINKKPFINKILEETSDADLDDKVYGVYNEETGIITWYYGNIGVI